MLKALDPATLAALQTVVTGIGGIILAALWGVWDRRNRDKKEARDGNAGERAALSKDLQDFITGLERDRDYHKADAKENRLAKDNCYYDRDNVWAGWREYDHLAHKVRHEALRIVWNLCLRFNLDAKDPEYKVPDLPNIQDIYHETKRRKDEQNGRS